MTPELTKVLSLGQVLSESFAHKEVNFELIKQV